MYTYTAQLTVARTGARAQRGSGTELASLATPAMNRPFSRTARLKISSAGGSSGRGSSEAGCAGRAILSDDV